MTEPTQGSTPTEPRCPATIVRCERIYVLSEAGIVSIWSARLSVCLSVRAKIEQKNYN